METKCKIELMPKKNLVRLIPKKIGKHASMFVL